MMLNSALVLESLNRLRRGGGVSRVAVFQVGEGALHTVIARRTPGGIEMLRASTAPLPGGFHGQAVPEQAAVLKSMLAAGGGTNGQTILVVPRSLAVVREFAVPSGTPEEQHQMAEFQLEREMPLPLDQLRFTHHEAGRTEDRTRIVALGVPKDRIDGLIDAFRQAGSPIHRAVVSSYGYVGLARAGGISSGVSAVVGLGEATAEILILDGGHPVFSRSVPMKELEPGVLGDELERSLISHGSRSGGRNVERIVIMGEGGAADTLAARLKERMNTPVESMRLNDGILRKPELRIDPVLAGVAGVALTVLEDGDRVPDLLHPPRLRKSLRLKAGHRLLLLGGVAVGLAIAWAYFLLTDKRQRLATLQADLALLSPRVQAVDEMRARTRLASQWTEERYAWIDLFEALQQNLDRSKIWLTQCTIEESGAMRLQGKAKDDEQVNELISQLHRNPVFERADPEYTKPNQDKAGYRFDFAIKIRLSGSAAKGAAK